MIPVTGSIATNINDTVLPVVHALVGVPAFRVHHGDGPIRGDPAGDLPLPSVPAEPSTGPTSYPAINANNATATTGAG
jgi:hypothetical protein